MAKISNSKFFLLIQFLRRTDWENEEKWRARKEKLRTLCSRLWVNGAHVYSKSCARASQFRHENVGVAVPGFKGLESRILYT